MGRLDTQLRMVYIAMFYRVQENHLRNKREYRL